MILKDRKDESSEKKSIQTFYREGYGREIFKRRQYVAEKNTHEEERKRVRKINDGD